MDTTNAPRWLATHLEAIGQADNDGYALRPRAGRCRRCHAPVIRALDGEVAALPATCDPQPLNAYGELWARQLHRHTYALTREGDRLRLYRRDPLAIRSRPPDATGRRYDVLAAHQCFVPPLQPLTTMPATTRSAITRQFPQFTEPPF
jgi:hypothetical protein